MEDKEVCCVEGCSYAVYGILSFNEDEFISRPLCRGHFELEDKIRKATHADIMRLLLEIERKVDIILYT